LLVSLFSAACFPASSISPGVQFAGAAAFLAWKSSSYLFHMLCAQLLLAICEFVSPVTHSLAWDMENPQCVVDAVVGTYCQ
jgi:hypothetical protein